VFFHCILFKEKFFEISVEMVEKIFGIENVVVRDAVFDDLIYKGNVIFFE